MAMTEFAKECHFPHSDNFVMLLLFASYNYEFVFSNSSGERSSLLFKEGEYEVA